MFSHESKNVIGVNPGGLWGFSGCNPEEPRVSLVATLVVGWVWDILGAVWQPLGKLASLLWAGWGKIASSINDAGKTGQLHVKE